MAALRKKLLEKKAAEQARQSSVPEVSSPAPAPAIAKSSKKDDGPQYKKGFLSAGTLYADGSTEAAPKGPELSLDEESRSGASRSTEIRTLSACEV